MALSITKSYADGDILTEADLDAMRESIQDYINVTKLSSSDIQTGGIATANIADLAISTDKLASSAVTTAKINDSAVTAAKIAANVITQAKVDNSVTFLEIGDYKVSLQTSDHNRWLICDGSAKSRTTYSALFALIGTKFGSGDGSTTFNLPKAQGYFMRFPDNGAGVDPNAGTRTAMQSGGATGDNIGSVQSSANLAHTHTLEIGAGGDGTLPEQSGTLNSTYTTSSSGGSESRPINAYFGNLFIYAGA